MRLLMDIIIRKDQHLFCFVNKRIKCTFLDKLMPLITHLGSLTFAAIISMMMLILDKLKIVENGVFVPFCIVATQTLVHIVKLMVNRPRPNLTLQDINVFNSVLEYYSFPSGHTAAAFAMAVSLSIICPVALVTIVLMIVATLVGISRMYIGVHYPTDVTIGAVLSALVILYLQPYLSYFYLLI